MSTRDARPGFWRHLPVEYVIGAAVPIVALFMLHGANPNVSVAMSVIGVVVWAPLIFLGRRSESERRESGRSAPNISPWRKHAVLSAAALGVCAVTVGVGICSGVWLEAGSTGWNAEASSWMWAGAGVFALVVPCYIIAWMLTRRLGSSNGNR